MSSQSRSLDRTISSLSSAFFKKVPSRFPCSRNDFAASAEEARVHLSVPNLVLSASSSFASALNESTA